MDWQPVALAKLDQGRAISIQWSDGLTHALAAKRLRQSCPCATCREKRQAPVPADPPGKRSLTILSPAELQPLTVDKMAPAGAYAYNIAFSDGHRSGLFTFEFLRALGEENAAQNPPHA